MPGLPADEPVIHAEPGDPALMYGEPVYMAGGVNKDAPMMMDP